MSLLNKCTLAFEENRRLTAPFAGYPGLQITGYDKLKAQSDHNAHYETIMSLFQRFSPDIVFPLMDLSMEVHALGKTGVFYQHTPYNEITAAIDAANLELLSQHTICDAPRIKENLKTLKLLTTDLGNKALVCAYCSAPFTLAGQILGLDNIAVSLLIDPPFVHKLLEICTAKLEEYVEILVKLGVDAICFLDPTAGLISPLQTDSFALQYLNRLIDICTLNDIDSIIHICGNTTPILPLLMQTNASAISLDSPETGIILPQIAPLMPEDMILMGNINPSGNILTAAQEDVESEVAQLLTAMAKFPNFILSTGCDLPQSVPLANLKAFFSKKLSCSKIL